MEIPCDSSVAQTAAEQRCLPVVGTAPARNSAPQPLRANRSDDADRKGRTSVPDIKSPLASTTDRRLSAFGPDNLGVAPPVVRQCAVTGGAARPCVLGIAAMSQEQYNTTVCLVLERMEHLCVDKTGRNSTRLQPLWLDKEICSKNDPAEWEKCDILWTLWCPALPLEKLKAYVDRVKPLELNEVAGLMTLCDRGKTLTLCKQFNIPVPRHIECNRGGPQEPSLDDSEDYIVVNGQRLDKPFVEKPLDSMDHDIYVYYPRSAGGGRVRLGRQGWGYAEFFGGRAHVRRTGSYVYERFIPSEGFELRLFVVGSDYVSAEAKQQLPVALGQVDSSASSSMPQFIPVSLEANEKNLARKVAFAFGQRTFNVDALRTQQSGATGWLVDGQTRQREIYVHDVDAEDGGIPNVMDPALIEDIAKALLKEIGNHHRAKQFIKSLMTSALSRARSHKTMTIDTLKAVDDQNMDSKQAEKSQMHRIASAPSFDSIPGQGDEDDPLQSLPENESSTAPVTDSQSLGSPRRWVAEKRVLCAVLAVFRHGDRTPKQKVKLKLQVPGETQDARFVLGLLCGWIVGGNLGVELLHAAPPKSHELRETHQMQRLYELLQATAEAAAATLPKSKSMENVQDGQAQTSPTRKVYSGLVVEDKDMTLLVAACKVLQNLSDIHAKIEADKGSLKVNLKWGGQLTRIGEAQSKHLAKGFRELVYPCEDMARMHASLRHDLKVHSSNEPRCAQTAAAFAQGLLNLNCPLGAVQVSFVRMDGLGRLDRERGFVHSKSVEPAKERAKALMESGKEIDENFQREALYDPSRYRKVIAELDKCRSKFGTVKAALEELAKAVIHLSDQLTSIEKQLGQGLKHSGDQKKLCEALPLIRRRWGDIVEDLKGDPKIVPSSGAAGILDNVKYDMRHSVPMFAAAGQGQETLVAAVKHVYDLSSNVATYAEIGQYGTTAEEKFEIARTFLQPMLRKLRWDLRVASGAELGDEKEHLRRYNELFNPIGGQKAGTVEQPVRSRLYFAHHSQMQTLVNLFNWAPRDESQRFISKSGEAFLSDMHLPLGYLCHLVLKLWRRPDALDDDSKYTVTLELSSGDEGSSANDDGEVPPSTLLHEGIPLRELDMFLSGLLHDEATSEAKDAKTMDDEE